MDILEIIAKHPDWTITITSDERNVYCRLVRPEPSHISETLVLGKMDLDLFSAGPHCMWRDALARAEKRMSRAIQKDATATAATAIAGTKLSEKDII